MYQPDRQIESIARVIQLSVAPVFLFTGISALIGVLTNRLARIIDRARVLEGFLPRSEHEQPPRLHRDLKALSSRARLVNRGITLCVAAALFVCAVIVALFAGSFVNTDVSVEVAVLFVAAMLAIIGALLAFLREVFVATASMRIGPH
jgi:hypothetical protein